MIPYELRNTVQELYAAFGRQPYVPATYWTTVRDFKDRLAKIFKNNEVGEYERVRDQFTKVIIQQLMDQNGTNTCSSSVWDTSQTYNQNYQYPEVCHGLHC